MMTANKIANSDLLDILFDGRNKAYGAYALRRHYNKRMTAAIGIVIAASLIVFASTMGNKPMQQVTTVVLNDSIKLVKVEEQQEVVIPVTPQPPAATRFRTEDFVVPVIEPDELVNDQDLPPTQDDMQDAVISNFKQDGLDATDIVAPAPPTETGTGLATLNIQPTEDYEKTFLKVEYEAEFPGGRDAWKRFLERYLQYPEQAIENGTQATVRVEFVVDKEGNISDIKALNNPGDGLAEEAVRIMRKSPQWRPAEQNGHKVKYRHIQGIVFRLQ